MEKISVSIVIPIYKTPEKILRNCIESVLNQTIGSVEILLIDDSPADTGFICDEYKEKDSRVVVFHQKKGGLSAGRNKGVREARGQWITFLDSDDWLDPETCEYTREIAENNDADVVIFGTVQEFNSRQSFFKYKFDNNTVFEGKDNRILQKEVLNNYGNIATAWAKLFKRQFLLDHDLFHNDRLSQGSEGVEFNIRVFQNANRTVFINNPFYHYLYYPGSLSASFDENNYRLIFECLSEIKREIETQENYIELYPLWNERVLSVIISSAVGGYFSPKFKVSYKERIKRFQFIIDEPCAEEVLKRPEVHNIGAARKFVLWCIRKKLYFLIIPVSYIRYVQKTA